MAHYLLMKMLANLMLYSLVSRYCMNVRLNIPFMQMLAMCAIFLIKADGDEYLKYLAI